MLHGEAMRNYSTRLQFHKSVVSRYTSEEMEYIEMPPEPHKASEHE